MHHKRLLSVLLAAAVLLGAVTAAGAVSVDSETTHTAATSEVTDGGTLSTSFAASAGDATLLAFTTSTTNPAVHVVDPETGERVRTYGEAALNQTYANSSSNHYHWERSISHAALGNLPIDAGENKTVAFKLVNNASAADPKTTWVNMSVTGVTNRTVLAASHTDGWTLTGGDSGVGLLGVRLFRSPADAVVSSDAVGINGTNSTIRVAYLSDAASAALANATPDLTAGAWTLSYTVRVGDRLVKTYYDEAPAGAPATYAVIEPGGDVAGEAAAVRLHLGPAYDDLRTVDITVTTEAPGLRDTIDAFGLAGVLKSITGML